jgi:hypothetical protein
MACHPHVYTAEECSNACRVEAVLIPGQFPSPRDLWFVSVSYCFWQGICSDTGCSVESEAHGLDSSRALVSEWFHFTVHHQMISNSDPPHDRLLAELLSPLYSQGQEAQRGYVFARVCRIIYGIDSIFLTQH